ncbi:hypothetical protein LIER_40956 [Lithospermum erythrorhizon]|uniref:Uncharacterized protein n=1 Tax=Lithospermum erythrorhizon TaxID=34254 RepID=A0AAV3R630_LITER
MYVETEPLCLAKNKISPMINSTSMSVLCSSLRKWMSCLESLPNTTRFHPFSQANSNPSRAARASTTNGEATWGSRLSVAPKKSLFACLLTTPAAPALVSSYMLHRH